MNKCKWILIELWQTYFSFLKSSGGSPSTVPVYIVKVRICAAYFTRLMAHTELLPVYLTKCKNSKSKQCVWKVKRLSWFTTLCSQIECQNEIAEIMMMMMMYIFHRLSIVHRWKSVETDHHKGTDKCIVHVTRQTPESFRHAVVHAEACCTRVFSHIYRCVSCIYSFSCLSMPACVDRAGLHSRSTPEA